MKLCRRIAYVLAVIIWLGCGAVSLFSIRRISSAKAEEKGVTAFRQSRTLRLEQLEEQDVPGQTKPTEVPEQRNDPYAELREEMEQANEELYATGQARLKGPWNYEVEWLDLTRYGITDSCIGTVTIPAINITAPIYAGASLEHLGMGMAHLTETSYPIGGMNTNTVLAAHRSRELLDVEEIQIGDSIFIDNLWETLEYRVSEIKIVNPSEGEAVLIQPGRDMLTLQTCHPYYTSAYRYLVYCDRVTDASDNIVLDTEPDLPAGTEPSEAPESGVSEVRVFQSARNEIALHRLVAALCAGLFLVLSIILLWSLISAIARKQRRK